MITLAFTFPWKRYHATPWGTTVNEGGVELPPSPWRILRALYATWKERHPDLPEADVHALLGRLITPPRYAIPPHQLSHTRHWVPDPNHRSGSHAGKDLAVDAFAVLSGDATIYATWPTSLDEHQEKILGQLAESLPYLGRADSIVDARLLSPAETVPTTTHAVASPLFDEDDAPPGAGTVQLMAPTSPLDFDALTLRPTDLRARRLLYPPHTRLVTYTQPPAVPTEAQRRQAQRPRKRRPLRGGGNVTAVRLTLGAPALPALTETVTLTDTLRSRVIKPLTADQRGTPRTSNLVGKDEHGQPLTGLHQHAHFLPYDSNGDRRIDEIIIWTPGGLDNEELDAIQQATEHHIGVPEGVPGPRRVHLRINAYGQAADILPPEWTRPSTTFNSTTPYVPVRHLRKHDTLDVFLARDAERELHFRGHPAPTHTTTVPGDWPLFTQHRWTRRETRNDNRPARGLHLTFAHPITGPLALGRHSHFGLGLLLPTSEPEAHPRNPERTEAKRTP